jgi:hypothetical protein
MKWMPMPPKGELTHSYVVMYPAAVACSAVMFSNLARAAESSGGVSSITPGGGPGCANAAVGTSAVAANPTINVRKNLFTSIFISVASS